MRNDPAFNFFPGAQRAGLAMLVCLVPMSLCGQQPVAPQGKNNPAPAKAGILFEPEIANFPPTAKFTNDSGCDVGIIYGPQKFKLARGASKSVPIPNQQQFHLDVFAVMKDGVMEKGFSCWLTPDTPKYVIPFTWPEPKETPKKAEKPKKAK